MPAEYPRATWREAHPKNYSSRPVGTRPSWIVLHATATGPGTGPATVNYFARENARPVSAHYVVFETGEVVQCVHEADRAHHAGASQYDGLTGFNDFSIGIEMVNLNDGQDPYRPEQIAAVWDLVWYVREKYGIPASHVVTHAQISTAGKTDPRGFPVQEIAEWTDIASAAIREEAWHNQAIPQNPIASLQKEASRLGLGAPQTDEFDLSICGEAYVAQGFALGIVACPLARWHNIHLIRW